MMTLIIIYLENTLFRNLAYLRIVALNAALCWSIFICYWPKSEFGVSKHIKFIIYQF